jgi:tetratricopeptide (TPR) repeat protein
MKRLLLIFSIVALLAFASCSRFSGSSNQDANASQSGVGEFGDPNVALSEGNRYLDEGETEKAIDALSQAVKLDPDLAEAWFKLGIAYALTEKRDETLVANEDTSSNKPSRSKPNSEKAFEKAVTAYKKVIEANEQDDVAYFNLGRAYNKLNEDQDAAKALKQAVKLKPDDTEYQTELGAILIKLAQYQEAIPPLKKALELDPENIRAQELLEDAEAGRSRVNYTSTPKDKSNSNTNANTNTNTTVPPDAKVSPPANSATPAKPRPTPTRPPN